MEIGQSFEIPFQDRWKDSIINGDKVCTTRTKRYGVRGDTFEAFGKRFILLEVEEVSLSFVTNLLYRAEGLDNAGDMVGVWNILHPNKGWMPRQRVYVHWWSPLNLWV